MVCPYGQIRFYTYNTVEFLLVWGYSGCSDEHMGGWYYVLGCLVIPLHWKEKNWSGLYDIDVVKWIVMTNKKTCTMCK